MQTSSGFSNTKRSPRDPSFESTNKRGSGEDTSSSLKLRPHLISSQNYNSLHQLRPTDRDRDMGSFRPLPGASLTANNGFGNIIEEEEFAYQDDTKHQQQHSNE